MKRIELKGRGRYGEPKPILIALIDGKQVQHDWCSSDLSRPKQEKGNEYLGTGILYSRDGVLHNDPTPRLFFRNKKD